MKKQRLLLTKQISQQSESFQLQEQRNADLEQSLNAFKQNKAFVFLQQNKQLKLEMVENQKLLQQQIDQNVKIQALLKQIEAAHKVDRQQQTSLIQHLQKEVKRLSIQGQDGGAFNSFVE